ncbi:MAG: RNA polymerase sigma factor [Firmicutes bacterium]|nr:RNA polymerase sigma factor [Bacillota bacterium]
MESNHSDEKLFKASLEGDEGAFKVLMDRYGDRVTVYIAARVADVQEAEDLMIEAFARMIHAAPALSGGEGSFRGYLFRTARTTVLKFNRQYRLKSAFSLEDVYEDPAAAEEFSDTASEILKNERSRILLGCMDRIKPEYREALYLMYFENMKIREIAGVMKKSGMAVNQLLRRGREALRKELEKEGITDAQY